MSTTHTQTTDNKDSDAGIDNSLIANTNHALRTPLHSLLGMADLLVKTGLNERQLKYAHIIHESTEALMLQFDNMIELNKINDNQSTVEMAPCRLDDVLKEAAQSLITIAAKKGVKISFVYGDDVPEIITADREKLKLIFKNLLNSTLKFIKNGSLELWITRESDTNNQNNTILRFSFSNSHALYAALQNSLEQDIKTADLACYGEITLGCRTVTKLLETIGVDIKPYLSASEQKQSFHFDLPTTPLSVQQDSSSYSVLKDKNILIFPKSDIDIRILKLALPLWGIDYKIVDSEQDLTALLEQDGQTELYDIFLHHHDLGQHILQDCQNKIKNTVTIKTEHSEGSEENGSAYLYAPVYPEELLEVLSSFYQNHQKETQLAEEASKHVSTKQYNTLDAKVMIVEDDLVNSMYASEMCKNFGCQVTTAESGYHALVLMNLLKEDYDIILMDCMMPRMDGYATTEKIRQAGYKTPIIALTANTQEKDKQRCFDAGMDDFIAKPVKEKDLHSIITKYYNNG